MPKREIIAYAITHAPRGVKGGPYEAPRQAYGVGTAALSGAAMWTFRPLVALGFVRRHVPHARVIRIVRRGRPSEASAVEVLRDLVASHDAYVAGAALVPGDLDTLMVRARAVLAASGPDPMPVVRAAMRYLDYGPDGRLGPAWVGFREAGEAYRKAGGTAGESTVDLSDPVVKRRWLGERIAAMGGFPATRKAGGK